MPNNPERLPLIPETLADLRDDITDMIKETLRHADALTVLIALRQMQYSIEYGIELVRIDAVACAKTVAKTQGVEFECLGASIKLGTSETWEYPQSVTDGARELREEAKIAGTAKSTKSDTITVGFRKGE